MNEPLVFTDFHHAGLLNSLILLFEKRLGGAVFRPIGMEWAQNGFWKVYDHPATQQQFLGIGGATPDGTQRLNDVVSVQESTPGFSPAWYNCKDIEGDSTNKAITFERFMEMPFDIVIATIPQHVEPFKKLCELHPCKPKLIFQIGNAWTIEAAMAPNVMASAIIHSVPKEVNFISYHQEFDLSTFYPQFGDIPSKKISSFVNCFDSQGHFDEDWRLFQQLEQLMLDWDFRSYGGQCRDGSCNGSKAVADMIRDSRFVWHTKAGGDGYGHVIHSVPACGRPLIVKKQYYEGKMAEPLLEDGKTCIVIDELSPEEIKNKIEHYSQPDLYKAMCQNAYNNFVIQVDFDKEEKELKNFLEKLL